MRLMDRSSVFLFAFLFLLIPAVSFANVGTPLMWVGMFHLFIGNLLLGVGEGIFLAKLTKTPVRKSWNVMVLANYISAWVGCALFSFWLSRFVDVTLNHVWWVFWLAVFIAYCLTILFEFPFVWFLLRKQENSLKGSIKASLWVQTVSYLILFSLYYMSSFTDLYSDNTIVDVPGLNLPGEVDVYYIGADDGDVYKVSLNDLQVIHFSELGSHNLNDRLFLKKSPSDSEQLDLRGPFIEGKGGEGGSWVIKECIGKNLIYRKYSWKDEDESSFLDCEEGTSRNLGNVLRLGDARNSPWSFDVYFWAAGGLHGNLEGTKEKAAVAYETPFHRWRLRNAMHLPSDIVLFQLGDNQICLYDPDKKEIALLARGRGPTAVIRGEE